MARSRLFNRNPMPGMSVGAWDKALWAWAQGKGPLPPMQAGTPLQRQLQAGTQQILGRTQAMGGGGALLGGGATGGGPAVPQPYGGRTPAEAGRQAGAKIRGPLGPRPGTISRLAVTTMTGKRTPGMFRGQDGKMYGEEEMGIAAGARTALSDAEVARRRKKHEKEAKTVMSGKGTPGKSGLPWKTT